MQAALGFLLLLALDPADRLREAMALGKSGPDTAENAQRLLGWARDRSAPDAVRGQALIAYAKISARRKHGAEAAKAIWALKGKMGEVDDPVYGALRAVGVPALPILAQSIDRCGGRELIHGRVDVTTEETAADDTAFRATVVLAAIVRDSPGAPEARAVAPRLVSGLGCADLRVRHMCVVAVGWLGRLEPRELAAVRKRLVGDGLDDRRTLAAEILAAVAARDPPSLRALESALSDRAEAVQLASARALMQLGSPARARPVLERLKESRDRRISELASSVLLRHPPDSSKSDSGSIRLQRR